MGQSYEDTSGIPESEAWWQELRATEARWLNDELLTIGYPPDRVERLYERGIRITGIKPTKTGNAEIRSPLIELITDSYAARFEHDNRENLLLTDAEKKRKWSNFYWDAANTLDTDEFLSRWPDAVWPPYES